MIHKLLDVCVPFSPFDLNHIGCARSDSVRPLSLEGEDVVPDRSGGGVNFQIHFLPVLGESATDLQIKHGLSGLCVVLPQGSSPLHAARVALNVYPEPEQGRLVLETQHWTEALVPEGVVLQGLVALADRHGVTICLKSAAAGYEALELLPVEQLRMASGRSGFYASDDIDLRIQKRRPYQQELVEVCADRVEAGDDRGLVVLPTGTGKTFGLTEALWEIRQRALLSGKKTLVVAQQEQINSQNRKELSERFSVGIYQGEIKETGFPVVVASPQTLCLHADEFPWDDFDILVLDEAHHYVPSNQWFEVVRRMGFFDQDNRPVSQSGKKWLLGLTATPDRYDGEPLVTVYGANLWYARDINYFIDHHWLLEPYGVDVLLEGLDAQGKTLSPKEVWSRMSLEEKGAVLADILTSTSQEGSQILKTVVFLNNRDEVLGLEKILNRDYGVEAVAILEDTKDRQDKIEALRQGKKQVMLNIGIAGEGFDDPGLDVAILCQDNESRGRVVQYVGRVMRVDPKRPEHRHAYLYDLMGVLRKHRIQVAAEEAYTWGGTGLKRLDAAERKVRQEREAQTLVRCGWNFGEYGDLVIENRRFFEVLGQMVMDEEGAIRAAYLAGLASDEVLAWYYGRVMPVSERMVARLAVALQDENQSLALAYQESVGAAIKAFLIRRLQERARELGRTPVATEMGGDYPSGYAYEKYLGGWNDALKVAGLVLNQSFVSGTTKERAVEIIKLALQEAGTETLSSEKYTIICRQHSDWPSASTISAAIVGSRTKWVDALRAIGLSGALVSGTSKDRAIEILKQAQQESGAKVLTSRSYDKLCHQHSDWPISTTLATAITGLPHKWNDALRAAGLSLSLVRGTSKEQALAILKQAQQESNGQDLSITLYQDLRRQHPDWPSSAGLCAAILGPKGNWLAVLKVAGLSVSVVTGTTKEQAIAILQEAKKELGDQSLTLRKYDQLQERHPDWPVSGTLSIAITGLPGKWNEVLQSAGFRLNQPKILGTTREKAIAILRQARQELGDEGLTKTTFKELRRQHPEWPSREALCMAIAGSQSQWSQALQAADTDSE